MSWFLAEGPHVSIGAEGLFHIGPVTISNSQLLGFLGAGLVLWLFFYTVGKVRTGKHNRFSIAIYAVFEILFNTVVEVLGDREKAKRLAPLAITLFFLITVNNWMGLLPFVGPVTYHGEPLFRGLASDLNFTAALAVITMVTAQVWAIRTHGHFGNLKRYFANPIKDPMHAFEGILELVAEFSRLIALAMRLFGNVFGGEVLLLVMGYITSWFGVVALPAFMLLELFVGAIQAYVFFMLTVVFVSLGSASHHEPEPDSPAINEPPKEAVTTPTA